MVLLSKYSGPGWLLLPLGVQRATLPMFLEAADSPTSALFIGIQLLLLSHHTLLRLPGQGNL